MNKNHQNLRLIAEEVKDFEIFSALIFKMRFSLNNTAFLRQSQNFILVGERNFWTEDKMLETYQPCGLHFNYITDVKVQNIPSNHHQLFEVSTLLIEEKSKDLYFILLLCSHGLTFQLESYKLCGYLKDIT